MSKSRAGKLVAASLHSELSEYASLLRALRTNDTLDIVSQLIKPTNSPSSSSHSGEDEDLEPEHNVAAPTSQQSNIALHSPSAEPVNLSGDALVIGPAGGKGKRRQRDTWTRWPLLAGDAIAPEWELEDEVQLLAAKIIDNYEASTSHTPPVRDDGTPDIPASSSSVADHTEVAQLPRTSLDAVAFAASAHLSQILGALAVQGPRARKSMTIRADPRDWKDVLDAVAMHGLVDEQTIRDVRGRMEVMKGCTPSNYIKVVNSTPKRKLHDRLAAAEFEMLSLVKGKDRHEPTQKKRKYVKQKPQTAPTDGQPASESSEDESA